MAGPLNAEHRKTIDASLKGLKEVQEILTRARSAGLDVDTETAEHADLTKKLQGIKDQFFPSR